MAAIGRIRKHGVFLMIIIGIALLAFIVGDLTNVVNFGRNTVLQVGKHKIEAGAARNAYDEYFRQNYELYKIKYGGSPLYEDNSSILNEEVHEYTYQQIQHEAMLDDQLKKLGLSFSDEMKMEISEKVLKSINDNTMPYFEDMNAILNYTLAELTENVQNPKDIETNYNYIVQALQSPEEMETRLNKESSLYMAYKAVERKAIIDAKENTYFGLAVNSIRFSKKMLNQMANDNSRLNGEMVTINPNDPKFDDIKIDVSESDAKAYFKQHKNRYITRRTEKDVEMAYFTVEPSNEDRINTAKLADNLFSQLQSSSSIKEFTAQPTKIEKVDLKYGQNVNDPYTYNMMGASVIATFAQVDTTLYLKAGETAMQKRNALSHKPYGYSTHAQPLANELKDIVLPSSKDSATFIAPIRSNNVYYFGQVRDVAERPDSIEVAVLRIPFTDDAKNATDMTEEEAYAKAQEIQAALDGKDTSAMLPYLGKYSFMTDTTKVYPFTLLDGASFDALGRPIYVPNDTLTANLFNRLIDIDTNHCKINKYEDHFAVYMVLHKSEPILKSQYVLYPVPVLASSATDKKARHSASNAANKNTIDEMIKEAKKNGGEQISTTITGMQYVMNVATGILDCREAINWAFNTNKNANNEVGSVAHNPFVGHLTTFNQATGETSVSEVFVVIGIKATTEVLSPSFKEMKERVISDMKAEKKREAVVERLKKEFNGKNMAELASKYGTFPQKMAVGFSEYGAMESAAVGKISNLTAGKTAVVSGSNNVYLVSVTSVDKAADVKNQMVEQITNQLKTSQKMDDAAAKKEAEKYVNMQYTNFAYLTALTDKPQSQQQLSDVVKQIVYNDIAADSKLVDNRSRFYGTSDR